MRNTWDWSLWFRKWSPHTWAPMVYILVMMMTRIIALLWVSQRKPDDFLILEERGFDKSRLLFLVSLQTSVYRGAGPRISNLKTLWYDQKATTSLCCSLRWLSTTPMPARLVAEESAATQPVRSYHVWRNRDCPSLTWLHGLKQLELLPTGCVSALNLNSMVWLVWRRLCSS